MYSQVISDFLIKADKTCDYLPVLSSFSNLVDLFYKYCVSPFLMETQIKQDRYYYHLDQKSVFRCIILIVPFLGNVIIALYDLMNWMFTENQQPSSVFASIASKQSDLVGHIPVCGVFISVIPETLITHKYPLGWKSQESDWQSLICDIGTVTLPLHYPKEGGGGLRKGHDFSHAARVERLAQELCDAFEEGKPECEKLNMEQRRALSLAGFCQRAGRIFEGKDDLICKRSSEIFEYYAKHLDFSQQVIQVFKESIEKMEGHEALNFSEGNIRALIILAHQFDLVRCFKLDKTLFMLNLSIFGNRSDGVYEEFRLRAHQLAEATGRCVIDRGDKRPSLQSDFHHVDERIMPLNTPSKKCLERVRSVIYVP